MNEIKEKTEHHNERLWRPDFLYALLLFLIAASVIAYTIQSNGVLAGEHHWGTAVFFLAFGLFTIITGFPHPGFGHVSFDRVAQVASILVLGPVDAAWINGLASFIYPWHRLRNGASVRAVLTAACNNAGLMSLVILLCGSLYEYLGGPVPLVALDLRVAGLLLLLMLSMQFLNDLGMMVIFYFRNLSPTSLFHSFSSAVESVSVLLAIIVAIAYTTADLAYFALLIVVLGILMLVLKQYALMRFRLEALVEERTEELRVQSIEFERQATHDNLTGLVNRRYADDYLQREIEVSHRHDRDFTIALADIDHFKAINDRHSHGVGDEVLRRVARILVDRCRKTDVVARYGGEEFLLCFPDADAGFARQICDQVRLAVQNADWSDIRTPGREKLEVTISIGVAESQDESRRATVLNEADLRLYRAKNEGRNRVVS
jgi:diguanylate cyclase (GGDEF)-like protein